MQYNQLEREIFESLRSGEMSFDGFLDLLLKF